MIVRKPLAAYRAKRDARLRENAQKHTYSAKGGGELKKKSFGPSESIEKVGDGSGGDDAAEHREDEDGVMSLPVVTFESSRGTKYTETFARLLLKGSISDLQSMAMDVTGKFHPETDSYCHLLRFFTISYPSDTSSFS